MYEELQALYNTLHHSYTQSEILVQAQQIQLESQAKNRPKRKTNMTKPTCKKGWERLMVPTASSRSRTKPQQ